MGGASLKGCGQGRRQVKITVSKILQIYVILDPGVLKSRSLDGESITKAGGANTFIFLLVV